jgi:hypothetical protein
MKTPSLLLISCLFLGCTSQPNSPQSQQRFLPVGNNPEIALDTSRGILCRTVTDVQAPANLFDPACELTDAQRAEQEKYKGFVVDSCKTGRTWVRSELKGAANYGALPLCIAAK